eukprot:3321617-Amphidinium_carterae.1
MLSTIIQSSYYQRLQYPQTYCVVKLISKFSGTVVCFACRLGISGNSPNLVRALQNGGLGRRYRMSLLVFSSYRGTTAGRDGAYIGVFDGHNGAAVADELQRHLHEVVASRLAVHANVTEARMSCQRLAAQPSLL